MIYSTTVTSDLHVIVTIDGLEVDRPGPWETAEQAQTWADLMLASLQAGDKHYPIQDGN